LHQDVKAIRASLLASAAARKLRCRRRAAAVGSQGSACKTPGARQRFPHASHRKPRNLFLRFRLHADHDERASRRESWTGGCSFVEKRHRSSARTAVSDDKYFVLVALPSARCGRAVEAYNSNGVLDNTWRARWTLRALRPYRARSTRLTFFTRRPDRARFPLRPLTTWCD